MTATIQAISYFLPHDVLTNARLAAEFPHTTADHILKMSGVAKRYISRNDETASDLALVAAKKLFDKLPESTVADIDVLLYCSEELNYVAPATACILHHSLGLKHSCLSIDISSGCTGFINGLLIAKGLLATHHINNVLFITAETETRLLHPNDIQTRSIFSDGACATLIARSEANRIGEFVMGTDGSGSDALWVEHSGFKEPASIEWLSQYADIPFGLKNGRLIMNGAKMLHFALTRVPDLIKQTLEANRLVDDDIDLYIFHQASKIILESLQKKCSIPSDKFFMCLEDYGNTVSSTIPIALHEALSSKTITTGDKVMLVGYGVGLAWGATVIEIP